MMFLKWGQSDQSGSIMFVSETKAKLDKYYSDSAPSYGIVQKWFTEFCYGCTSTETTPSSGRPNEITIHQKLSINCMILF